MRLSTTMQPYPPWLRDDWIPPALSSHGPERDHDDDQCDELEQDPQPHQLLRRVGRAAPHHVDKTEQQNKGTGPNCDRHETVEEGRHAGVLALAARRAKASIALLGHPVRTTARPHEPPSPAPL